MPAFISFLISLACVITIYSFVFKHFILILIFIPLIAFLLLISKKKFLILNLILVFIVSLSSFVQIKPYFLKGIPQNLYGRIISIMGKVNDYSEETIYPKSFVINSVIINSERYSGSLRVYTDQDFPPPFSNVTIRGTLNKVDLKSDIEKLTRCQYSMYSNEIVVDSALGYAQTLSKIRQEIIDRIRLSMKSEEAFLLISSIMGIYSLSNEERAPFEKTGTAHIFAVSGLHMSILGETLNKFLGYFFIFSPIITLIILLFFILLIGFKISALRAILMYAVFALAKTTGRESNNLNVLGFAGIIILIFFPVSTFSISFQLSFVSIFALFVFAPFISQSLPDKFPYKILAATVSIQIFLLPLIAFYFGTFSISSFIANLFAIPYMSILVPAGFIQVIASVLGRQVSNFFAPISNFLYSILNSIIGYISKLPFSSINVNFSFINIILFFTILSFLLLILWKKKKMLLLSIAILVSSFVFSSFMPRSFTIHPYKLGGENFFIVRDTSSTVLLFFKNQDKQIFNMSDTLERDLRLEGINNINVILVAYPIDNESYSNALEFAKRTNIKIGYLMLPNLDNELIKIFSEQTKNKINLATFKNDSTIKIGDYSFILFSESSNNAILLERNRRKYLLLGSSKLFNSPFKERLNLDEIYFPDGFELSSLKDHFEFSKIYKY